MLWQFRAFLGLCNGLWPRRVGPQVSERAAPGGSGTKPAARGTLPTLDRYTLGLRSLKNVEGLGNLMALFT
jgi:hypothetical protein